MRQFVPPGRRVAGGDGAVQLVDRPQPQELVPRLHGICIYTRKLLVRMQCAQTLDLETTGVSPIYMLPLPGGRRSEAVLDAVAIHALMAQSLQCIHTYDIPRQLRMRVYCIFWKHAEV